MSRCVYVAGDGEDPCGAEATLYSNFFLCPEHQDVQRGKMGSGLRRVANQSLGYHSPEDFPGICYMVLVPGGLVKIGYSNTEERYAKRLKELTNKLGPVVEILKMPGGFVLEAHLHSKFKDESVPGPGELFTYSERIAKYVKHVSDNKGFMIPEELEK